MKFDLLFPDAKVHDEPLPCIFKFRGKEPCWICGELTSWGELNFETAMCSEECVKEAWDRFWRDYNGQQNG